MSTHTFKFPSEMPAEIFRAYDVRGIVHKTLTPDVVYATSRAIGTESQERGEKTVIIGRDGRLSGPLLFEALTAGLLASGCDVIDIGMVPSPVLYFATHHLTPNSGVMLTGSHNPMGYNGLKIVLGGNTLTEAAVQSLRERVINNALFEGQGSVKKVTVREAYIGCIVDEIKLDRPLKVVIDCGNGVGGDIAPELFRRLGCDVIDLYCDVDGQFPNHHPDPSREENLQDLIRSVRELNADIGLGFDGDADRLGVVTNKGEIIWPDRQMMLFAIDILSRKPGSEIVFDVKCSNHLEKVIDAHGGRPVLWKTGHSLIKRKMQELGAELAGEMSGHIFFKERWFGFDDGLYAGVRLLEILASGNRTASDIFDALPNSINTPELKVDIPEETKFSFMEQLAARVSFPDARVNTIDGVRVEFDDGWGLVRASNTTPCLTLRFEAETQASLQAIQARFQSLIHSIDPTLVMPF